MIKGTTHIHLGTPAFTSQLEIVGRELVASQSGGPQMCWLRLLPGGEVERLEWCWPYGEGCEVVHRLSGARDGRWALHTSYGTHPTDHICWLRVLGSQELGEQGQRQEPWRLDGFLHHLAFVEDRLLATFYNVEAGREEVVELMDDRSMRVLLVRDKSWAGDFGRVELPGGRQGLRCSGDIYTWSGDELEKTWALGLRGVATFSRIPGPGVAPQSAPWGEDGIYFLRASFGTHRGGGLYRVRPGQEVESVWVGAACSGVLALPQGAVMVVVQPTKTHFARILFPEEGRYLSLSPKAMGLVNPAIARAWWSQEEQALYAKAGATVVRMPWEGLLAQRRLKIK